MVLPPGVYPGGLLSAGRKPESFSELDLPYIVSGLSGAIVRVLCLVLVLTFYRFASIFPLSLRELIFILRAPDFVSVLEVVVDSSV